MAMKVKELRFTFRELRMRHFRAFENALLPLDGMTVLLGRNGAGKTSIMVGLEFFREAVVDSLSNAIARRGGLKAIRQHQAAGAPYDVSVALKLASGPISVVYGFVLGARRGGSGFEVKEEVLKSSAGKGFRRKQNEFDTGVSDLHPSLDQETLALPMIAGAVPLWKQVLRTVRQIRPYSLSPATIGAEPEIGSTTWLRRDGGNASDVLKSLESRKTVKSWIVRHLAALTPGITDIWTEDTATGRRLIYFQQRTNGRRKQSFASAHMSDGTLRGLGVLLALRQRPAASLVFIDEIEDSVHPAALAVVLDAIAEAMSRRIQVVITSHSPEVLSHPAVSASNVRVLEWRDGVSAIYLVAASIRKDLRPPETVGSLLRTNALWPAEHPCTIGDDFFEA
jgi:predicted ATPase